jgi:hypothetical protein
VGAGYGSLDGQMMYNSEIGWRFGGGRQDTEVLHNLEMDQYGAEDGKMMYNLGIGWRFGGGRQDTEVLHNLGMEQYGAEDGQMMYNRVVRKCNTDA